MEEDIKILEDLAFELKFLSIGKDEIRQGIALYNLIEKNKKLEENQCNHNIDNGCIRKSKVQEKIKKLRTLQMQYTKDYEEGKICVPNTLYKHLRTTTDKIEALEELLKK